MPVVSLNLHLSTAEVSYLDRACSRVGRGKLPTTSVGMPMTFRLYQYRLRACLLACWLACLRTGSVGIRDAVYPPRLFREPRQGQLIAKGELPRDSSCQVGSRDMYCGDLPFSDCAKTQRTGTFSTHQDAHLGIDNVQPSFKAAEFE